MANTARVLKFTLAVQQRQEVLMPRDTKILSVQNQGNLITIWAQCDCDALVGDIYVERVFNIFPTGGELPTEGREYVATVQLGALVWHIFEVMK